MTSSITIPTSPGDHPMLTAAQWMPSCQEEQLHWVPAGSRAVGTSAIAWDGYCGGACIARWDGAEQWPPCPICVRAAHDNHLSATPTPLRG